jgi:hypothetical protein
VAASGGVEADYAGHFGMKKSLASAIALFGLVGTVRRISLKNSGK